MENKSFEEALEQLEEIARELEKGELSLEESLKKFDNGIKLADFCNHKLEDAQKKVEILLKQGDRLVAEDFTPPHGAVEE